MSEQTLEDIKNILAHDSKANDEAYEKRQKENKDMMIVFFILIGIMGCILVFTLGYNLGYEHGVNDATLDMFKNMIIGGYRGWL